VKIKIHSKLCYFIVFMILFKAGGVIHLCDDFTMMKNGKNYIIY